jgi:uncharacterized protein (TIGR02246 family)
MRSTIAEGKMRKIRLRGLSITVGVLTCGILGGAHGHEAIGLEASNADEQAIERLHRQDVDATLARDPQALAELFADDAVLLEPGAPAVLGKPAILAENKKDSVEHPNTKIVSYKPEIKDLQIVDGWAFEWDTFEASYKESEKAEGKSFRGKALRILQKQPDGSWKFARVMWNLAE